MASSHVVRFDEVKDRIEPTLNERPDRPYCQHRLFREVVLPAIDPGSSDLLKATQLAARELAKDRRARCEAVSTLPIGVHCENWVSWSMRSPRTHLDEFGPDCESPAILYRLASHFQCQGLSKPTPPRSFRRGPVRGQGPQPASNLQFRCRPHGAPPNSHRERVPRPVNRHHRAHDPRAGRLRTGPHRENNRANTALGGSVPPALPRRGPADVRAHRAERGPLAVRPMGVAASRLLPRSRMALEEELAIDIARRLDVRVGQVKHGDLPGGHLVQDQRRCAHRHVGRGLGWLARRFGRRCIGSADDPVGEFASVAGRAYDLSTDEGSEGLVDRVAREFRAAQLLGPRMDCRSGHPGLSAGGGEHLLNPLPSAVAASLGDLLAAGHGDPTRCIM